MTQLMDREPDARGIPYKMVVTDAPDSREVQAPEDGGQRFGSRLTPAERDWQLNVWWPAARTQLRRAAGIES